MSIVTKKGDQGATTLMYGRRVAKCHPRVEACGVLDELNTALGLARATAEHEFVRDNVLAIQRDLVVLMGELAVVTEDLPRYTGDGNLLVTPKLTARLDELITVIEGQQVVCGGWSTPGATLNSAALDVARATCRRAERRVCGLREAQDLQNPEILIYLNRLSDLLWLLAQWVAAEK
jgi:cob(I)alamin adenosyltransferase